MIFPKGLQVIAYLLVLAAGGALVLGDDVEDWLSPQPANTPNKPNNTIRVNNLFIYVRVTFTRSLKRTSKKCDGANTPHGTRKFLASKS